MANSHKRMPDFDYIRKELMRNGVNKKLLWYRLIAVLDLIDGYPEAKLVFIGFFMSDTGIQRCGIGTKIIEELTCYLQSSGYRSVQLGWMKGNRRKEYSCSEDVSDIWLYFSRTSKDVGK